MDLEKILPYMAPDLPGYDAILALQKLKLAIREFCQLTESWRETLAAINLVEDEPTYYINSTQRASIPRITSLKIDDVEQSATNYTFDGAGTLVLADAITPAADSTGALVVTVALIPRSDIKRMEPDAFVEQWRDAFMAGALARLQVMKNKGWFNPADAKTNAIRFESYKAVARREAQAGHRAVQLKVSVRPWR